MRMERFIKTIIVLSIVGFIQCEDKCPKNEKCFLEPESGPCFAYLTRYYYDREAKECRPFVYGGCGGVVPFETLEACNNGCHCD